MNRPLRALLRNAKSHKRPMTLVFALTLVGSAIGLAQPLVVQSVINGLTLDESIGAEILVLISLLVASTLLTAWQTWLGGRTAEHVVLDIRRGLIGRLIRLRILELDRLEPGSLTTCVTSDSTVVQHAATTGVIELLDGGIHLAVSIALMAMLSLPLFGVTAAVLLLAGIGMGIVVPRIRRSVAAMQESVGNIGAALDRSLGAARTVKANGAEAKEIDRADKAACEAHRAGLVGARHQSIIAVLSSLALQMSFLAVIGVGGMLTAAGQLDIATLIAFLLYLFNLGAPIISLVTGVIALHQGLGAMQRIDQINQMPVEDDVDHRSRASLTTTVPSVTVDGITFAYPGREPALDGATFVAKAGETTAIVGLSGAGKSTIFSLLQRFYDLGQGQILLGAEDINALSRAEVRQRIAYVEQDAPMLAGTIGENLLYAAAAVSPAAIDDVLQQVGLDELVNQLPKGLDTTVGARGITLSGGERQRLAVARALLRRPQVLLLDEVSAHLDARSELAMRGTIEAAARRCTVLIVAHRISTVSSANQLVVLEQGKVRATGTHAELLATDALYRELVENQLLTPEVDQTEDASCPSPTLAPSTTSSSVTSKFTRMENPV
ncbi:ABC transporter ATP-binding protein [Pseudonocardia sp. ICBG601]|uniref:ABC transporter ATP-binding protein n=1 Tax=Pseudonocardia sp. ICBG601 TaxID=2846759 RepID=UPI001CF619E5|nr:ABC transporter ATP-binding protein [Pseudonocardia sp. ICBG601]